MHILSPISTNTWIERNDKPSEIYGHVTKGQIGQKTISISINDYHTKIVEQLKD